MTNPASGFNLNDLLQLGSLYLSSTPMASQIKARGGKFRAESAIVKRHLVEAAKEIGALPQDSNAGIAQAVQAIMKHWQTLWTEDEAPGAGDGGD